MNRANLLDFLARSGLSQSRRESVESLMRPCARLRPTKSGVRIKIGGTPLMGRGSEWPMLRGHPLAFVAQIWLPELAGSIGGNVIPQSGMLSFFYNPVDLPQGFEVRDQGNWRVVFQDVDGITSLSPRPCPGRLSEDFVYGEIALAVGADASQPPLNSLWTDSLDLKLEERKSFLALEDSVNSEEMVEGPLHRFLGYPRTTGFASFEQLCQLARHGIDWGDGSAVGDPRHSEILQGANEWRLLLQLDSIPKASILWGDVGFLSFWIREEDLRHGAFENVWMVLSL